MKSNQLPSKRFEGWYYNVKNTEPTFFFFDVTQIEHGDTDACLLMGFGIVSSTRFIRCSTEQAKKLCEQEMKEGVNVCCYSVVTLGCLLPFVKS